MNNHFFAYLSKMRWIHRWGMKRNAIQENVMEHSFEVAAILFLGAILSQRRLWRQRYTTMLPRC
jgi:5'-deoxynucleotidase